MDESNQQQPIENAPDTHIKAVEQSLAHDRAEWSKKIKTIIGMLRGVSELSECQVMMLSYRQMLVDKLSEFKSKIYKKNGTVDKIFKQRYIEYTTQYNLKLSSAEKAQFIKADMDDIRLQIQMLQGHVDFYIECIKTLDNMAFAIRNRIKLNEDDM